MATASAATQVETTRAQTYHGSVVGRPHQRAAPIKLGERALVCTGMRRVLDVGLCRARFEGANCCESLQQAGRAELQRACQRRARDHPQTTGRAMGRRTPGDQTSRAQTGRAPSPCVGHPWLCVVCRPTAAQARPWPLNATRMDQPCAPCHRRDASARPQTGDTQDGNPAAICPAGPHAQLARVLP